VTDYSEQQLIGALRKADAAGDVAAAKAIARRIQSMRQQPADFSGVQGGSTTAQAEAVPVERATDGMSGVDRFRAGLGKSMVDTALGAKQFVTEGLAGQAAFADKALGAIGADGARGALNRNIGAPLMESVASQRQQADERRAIDADLMDTGAGMAGNVAGQIAQLALPASKLSKIPSLGAYGSAALSGGAFSAAQPMGQGDSRFAEAGKGAAMGAIGQGIAAGASRLGKGMADKLSPQVLEVYQRAQQAGIPVHFSQLSDSKFAKTLASAVGYLPFSGSGSAAAKQQGAFNSAVARSFGEGAENLSDDVMGAAKRRIGGEFDGIYTRNKVQLDDAALGKLAQVEAAASRNLPPNEAQIVKNQIDDLLSMGDNGVMPGDAYQAFRTDRLLPMEGGQKSFLANSIREIRKTLDDAANRSVGPKDAAALKNARGQYRNLKTAEKALKQVEGAKGNVRPASLWAVVNGAKGSSAEMRELAKIGQMIKDPIPDSGTAGRLLTYGGLAGAGGVGGAASLSPLLQLIALGATAGRAMNSQAATKYITQGNKPLRGLARLMRPAPLVLPAVSNAAEKNRP
jgi:hypothetical protein